MEKLRHSAILGESLYINRLQNGLTCYIIPRKDYVGQSAMLCVNYGSIDARFTAFGREHEPPRGIAHFLEHKMFEDAQINLFDEFVRLGASVNAYTNFQSTAYYFSCTDMFYDSLRLLLRLVTLPHFTDENVDKEKGIITQEIGMYDDNPFWRAYSNMQRAMYAANPVRDSILGDTESIGRITPDSLRQVYDAFYHPQNMALVCVGRFSREEVYKIARKAFVGAQKHTDVTRLRENEPPQVSEDFISSDMSLSKPTFSLGFKEDADLEPSDARTVTRKAAAAKALMDVLAGQSSELFNGMYRERLVDTPISLEYISGRGFGQVVFGASSNEPEKARERILREIDRVRQHGVESTRFRQILNKHVGSFFRLFNSIEALRNLQADLYCAGVGSDIDIFDLSEAYAGLCAEDLDKRLRELFRSDNHVLSIVR
ncbi:MAG: insulinase family protein [Defluviitaleaceae bacterium]|nr:insulinase family protein [Defluviitaleaceae bacterium]